MQIASFGADCNLQALKKLVFFFGFEFSPQGGLINA